MAFRAFRPAAAMAARTTARRGFHTTRPAFVKAGDPLPDAECLVEGSPGNKVNIAKEFSLNNGLIIGVPAAFSGACSTSHIPSYMKHPKIKDVGQVFVVSVNDAFVWVFFAVLLIGFAIPVLSVASGEGPEIMKSRLIREGIVGKIV